MTSCAEYSDANTQLILTNNQVGHIYKAGNPKIVQAGNAHPKTGAMVNVENA